MLDRLQIVKQRFDEISDLIIQPDVIADQKRYVQLNKEYKDLKALAEKRDEYVTLTGNIEEANEIISDGSDAEMVEMAKMQLEEAKDSLKGVISDKSYPPEAKAEATLLMGEIKFKQKALADAYLNFERLYLSFRKFPAWSCKGYLRAGETKEAMGKFEDAKAVYREAVDNPKNIEKFKGLEDFEKIKARLKAIL